MVAAIARRLHQHIALKTKAPLELSIVVCSGFAVFAHSLCRKRMDRIEQLHMTVASTHRHQERRPF